MMQLVSVGSTGGESNFHLQFTPKYRRDVFLEEEVRALCRESFRQVGVRRDADRYGGVRVRARPRPRVRE